jgi:mono/diheme cytochrome c family protein
VLVQGATAQHAFAFKNTGDAPLEIKDAHTSCGCTAALPAERVVPPGGQSAIQVTYDSRGKIGSVHKSVFVETNDLDHPVVELVIKGLVAPSQHPAMTGAQNLFEGSCRACHADRGIGKTGQALFAADCAMCHEHHKMKGTFIAAAPEDMAGLPARSLRRTIAQGREGTSMPAFHKSRGGPLSDPEIASLVKFIKESRK